jgi:hypothetical protein
MSIKDVTVIDLALLELLRGSTEAPPPVLEELRAKGHLTITAGVPSLTPKGRRRAESLRDFEHDMRLMFNTQGGSALRTDGAASLHIGGGAAKIKS